MSTIFTTLSTAGRQRILSTKLPDLSFSHFYAARHASFNRKVNSLNEDVVSDKPASDHPDESSGTSKSGVEIGQIRRKRVLNAFRSRMINMKKRIETARGRIDSPKPIISRPVLHELDILFNSFSTDAFFASSPKVRPDFILGHFKASTITSMPALKKGGSGKHGGFDDDDEHVDEMSSHDRFSKTKCFTCRRRLKHPTSKIFDIVADVGNYDNHLPYCIKSSVLDAVVHPDHHHTKFVLAQFEVGFQPFVESYRPTFIITDQQAVKAVLTNVNIFKKIICEWKFIPGNSSSSPFLEMKLTFELKGQKYLTVPDEFFVKNIHKQMDAFLKWADK